MQSSRPFAVAFLCATLVPAYPSQAAPRPQPYFIRGVALERGEQAKRANLLLRDGAIEAVLDESAPTPPGTRVIEGQGLLCLPAFLDAYTRQGCTVPQPVRDQDLPPDAGADVGVDMRLANRKGIQPAFRAVEALAVTKEQGEAWRKSGFGAALVAPGGELLSGSSALVSTREAAMRDLVVRGEIFAHAAFAASGEGYPSTLMGYTAQLRQFLLDSRRQDELERRYEQNRPGLRPPFDAELGAGVALISGRRTLLCEAQSASDIERWLRLADEFGVRIAISGGLEAARVAPLLVARKIPVVLTLDWGKEIRDPRPKQDEPDAGEKEGESPSAAQGERPPAEGTTPESPDAAAQEPGTPEAGAAPKAPAEGARPELRLTYEEPYEVRLERRRKWEEGRDCALRLHESGVRFAFGSASGKPAKLLENVRALVKAGLPAEAALAALTTNAAELLGTYDRLGKIAPGYDATFTLWRADPLTDEKATAAWTFVDGFPSEFPEEKKKEAKKEGQEGAGPAEGLDPTGTWELEFEVEGEGMRSATLVLEMDEDGSLSGTLTVESPMDGKKVDSPVEGRLSGDELELEATLSFGEFQIETRLTATLAGDELDGQGSFKGPWSEEPMTQPFDGRRKPERR